MRSARASVELAEEAFGPSHPATAEALGALAQILVADSQLDGVEAMYARAIEITTRVAGPESPEVAALVNNLAMAWEQQGDLQRAIAGYERVIAIYERA
ncbi:MAG: tetratricopeptide repeat protein, partial [Betaproteobacteria bacterium]|nr:tetratricopeptide repeat protein [Betaproteobacteria bacterium]